MRELAAEGVSIILYSSEDAELLGIADRILCLTVAASCSNWKVTK